MECKTNTFSRIFSKCEQGAAVESKRTNALIPIALFYRFHEFLLTFFSQKSKFCQQYSYLEFSNSIAK
jgi:hypothetical protein